jgi:methylthioribose-1-phosphate isomerase
VDQLCRLVLEEAEAICKREIEICKQIGLNALPLTPQEATFIHHCNTGALATVDWGTALGVIRTAHEQGKRIFVLVDETRPRLQGARLTAWELQQYGIPFAIISDGAAGHFLRTGQAQKVFFGADRVAANGDVANKVGTYMLALAARSNGVPVYAVAPSSSIDLSIQDGGQIPIEERDADEVLNIQVNGERVAPEGAAARNPAFDVTPCDCLTAIVTEKGIVYPPFLENFPRVLRSDF